MLKLTNVEFVCRFCERFARPDTDGHGGDFANEFVLVSARKTCRLAEEPRGFPSLPTFVEQQNLSPGAHGCLSVPISPNGEQRAPSRALLRSVPATFLAERYERRSVAHLHKPLFSGLESHLQGPDDDDGGDRSRRAPLSDPGLDGTGQLAREKPTTGEGPTGARQGGGRRYPLIPSRRQRGPLPQEPHSVG